MWEGASQLERRGDANQQRLCAAEVMSLASKRSVPCLEDRLRDQIEQRGFSAPFGADQPIISLSDTHRHIINSHKAVE
jgi:hypothetical protein